MKYNAKFTKIEDGYYRAKINNVELWEVDELLVWTIKEREKEIERLNKIIDEALEKINDYKIYCKKNKGFTEYTDIEIEAIEPVISKLEDILKEVSE